MLRPAPRQGYHPGPDSSVQTEGARGGALTQRESAEGWGFTPEGSGAHASAVFRRWGFTVKPQVSPSTHPWGYLLNHTRGSEVAVTGYHH